MKFLAKDPASRILADALVYKLGGHNDRLLELLRDEQRGYCAYTEKRFSSQDDDVIEHFDSRLKGTARDGYDNYYAALQSANQRKRRKDREHLNAAFFTTRFFQAPGGFELQIRYIAGEGVYEAIDPNDGDALALIDYLGLNDHDLVEVRLNHVAQLRDIFDAAQWSRELQLEHLRRYPHLLSYPTALAAELHLDLDPLLRAER